MNIHEGMSGNLTIFKTGFTRHLLARCILSLTSMYSCSCLTPVRAVDNSFIISPNLFWCSEITRRKVHVNGFL